MTTRSIFLGLVLLWAYPASVASQPDPQASPDPSQSPKISQADLLLLRPYLYKIHQRVKATWRAPNLGPSNKLKVCFMVNRAGQVHTTRVLNSSGDTTLDEAALAALSRVQLDPLPARYTGPDPSFSYTWD